MIKSNKICFMHLESMSIEVHYDPISHLYLKDPLNHGKATLEAYRLIFSPPRPTWATGPHPQNIQ